ncbi:MAG: O-acetyl-ADP-ribose deacetylase [Lentisphaerae bacterium GWF2_52_8]|nr:MAG: O-acetyl-ADP-ribose deacetylase [Lentisphaerae bacterium GWF2_52_8]
MIEIRKGDITRENCAAIVNAANCSLLGGGGVDGAIHRAAGPELVRECRTLGGCPTGEARITKAYKLPCRFVIHTVGPVWGGDGEREKKLLSSCYRSSLKLAAENELESIAFPSISTGAYGYPIEQACRIALRETKAFLASNPGTLKLVCFICFSDSDKEAYEDAWKTIRQEY